MQKFFRRSAAILLIFTSLLLTTVAYAEIKTYSDVGEYLMTNETIDFAKNQAELEAERKILEQVSFFIKERATMIDNELDEDEIITISAGILRVTDTKFLFEDDAQRILVKAFVTAEIDIDELKNLLEQSIKEHSTK